mgnify:CR=1 FL=1
MTHIKLAVVGSRSIKGHAKIYHYLDRCVEHAAKQNKQLIIVTGGAAGVDTTAFNFAKSRGLICINVMPAWQDRNGNTDRGAGFKRNEIIWEIADCGIAFWDRISKGTEHSFKLAADLHKKLQIVEADELPW